MNTKQIFSLDLILRDLAEQYLKGSYNTDEYLDAVEEALRQQVTNQLTQQPPSHPSDKSHPSDPSH